MARKSNQQPEPQPESRSVFENPLNFEWVLFDLGNANARMWCSGLAQPISWRSVQGRIGHKTRYAKLPPDWAIREKEISYVFGERAYAECPDTLDDWPTTDRYVGPWYKRMFAFGLYRAFQYREAAWQGEPYEPTIILSVPAKEYSNAVRYQAIEDKLVDMYKIRTVGDETIEVDITANNLNIVPEGLGSFLYTSNQNPKENIEEGLWVVLDLGYLTGDYTEFFNGVYVSDSPDSNDRLGMSYVSQRVADYIHGMGGPALTAAYIDPMVNKSSITLSNTPYDVGDEYQQSMTELSQRIEDWMARKTANKDIRGVLLTGGNVQTQASYLAFDRLPKPIVCPDGEFGNLFGAHLMLQGL